MEETCGRYIFDVFSQNKSQQFFFKKLLLFSCNLFMMFVLQELETLDNGKPYAVAYTVDLPMVVKCLR